jgi:hypothetical protein
VKYAEQLVSNGIVSKKNEGKEVFYINDDLLRIISDSR